MRRLVGLVVLLVLALASAAPALASCHLRAPKACCCGEARPDVLCRPDCCDAARPARPLADLTHVRALFLHAPPRLALLDLPATPAPSVDAARARVGLHERASPRLPLRI